MAQFLWDLSLQDFPCGWQHLYEEAFREYPKGKEIEWVSTTKILVKEWVDPVQTYHLLQKTFLNYKTKALDIMANLNALEMRDSFTQLLNIDVALFNLLFNWIAPIKYLENNEEFFRPFEYFNKKLYMNYLFYFGIHPFEPLDTFSALRIVDINFRCNT